MTNQTNPNPPELLPCPFCGNQPELMEGHRNHWRVECPKCGVRRAQFANGGAAEDQARAVRCWNRRADNETKADEALFREALNAIVDRAPERDVKWAGMTARDIALFALNPPGAE